MVYVVQVDFHHGVDSVAVLVSADDKDAAEAVTLATFEEHPDWAVQFVSVVGEADLVDRAKFEPIENFN